MSQITAEQKKSALAEALQLLYEAIRDLGGVPSGHLYARLMGHMTLDQYNSLIGLLKTYGMVKETNFYLTAIPLQEKKA